MERKFQSLLQTQKGTKGNEISFLVFSRSQMRLPSSLFTLLIGPSAGSKFDDDYS